MAFLIILGAASLGYGKVVDRTNNNIYGQIEIQSIKDQRRNLATTSKLTTYFYLEHNPHLLN
jgi:hypothetical protein